ncbi:MAG: metal ABC transporter permease, partial [Treponema sp.]|nr:metal ABC transporter permease [Treponema sp.]
YNKLFAITFDETFAKATGVKTGLYNMLVAFLTAITIVLGMRMMGAMLISSLVIFPALTSMRLFKKFKSVTVCSALLSVACFFIGVIVSYIYATPTGASVVVINIVAFMIFWGISALANGRKAAVSASAVSLAALFLFFGCGNTKTFLQKNNAAGTLSVALPADLSGADPVSTLPEADRGETVEIREKMFIAQVNDVYLNPEDYLGRTIKLEGLFKSEQYGEQPYCFVIRYGPGCCGNDGNSGFEIAWDNQDSADKRYPDIDDWVEATGVLQTYEEDGYPYLYLALSSLDVLDNRGAEFVTQ